MLIFFYIIILSTLISPFAINAVKNTNKKKLIKIEKPTNLILQSNNNDAQENTITGITKPNKATILNKKLFQAVENATTSAQIIIDKNDIDNNEGNDSIKDCSIIPIAENKDLAFFAGKSKLLIIQHNTIIEFSQNIKNNEERNKYFDQYLEKINSGNLNESFESTISSNDDLDKTTILDITEVMSDNEE